MDEQNQNLPIFGIKLWFSKLKKKIANDQSSEIVEFQKLANFKNLTICKTIKIQI